MKRFFIFAISLFVMLSVYADDEGVIIPSGSEQSYEMKGVIGDAPSADAQGNQWYDTVFDDSGWGNITIPVDALPENTHYYLRRTFNIEIDSERVLFLNCKHDDGIEVRFLTCI